jgi:hypothetical protein
VQQALLRHAKIQPTRNIYTQAVVSARAGDLVARMGRPSFVNGKPGRIAIAVSLQTSRVVALMLGVSQGLGFSGIQFGIVASFQSVFASQEVALVL